MKKFQTLFAWLLLLSMAAYSYSLQGKVVDENGNPISGAKATLLSKNKEALTDANGEFLIEEAQVSLTTGKIPVGSWALQNGVLSISSNSTASFQVKIFDLVGNEIFSKKMSGSGVHSLNLQRISAKGKYVVNLLQGNRREVFALSSTENLSGTFSNGKTSVSESKVFKKEVGENDLLQVVAEAFDTLTVPLSNLDTSLTLTLKKSEVQYAFGWAKGNAAVPTRGCGKTWNRVKSGSYEFAWSKGTRTIRIDIPDNYDNHKPYRLVFGMHCMGGWAGGVQQEGYYGLKPLDTQKTTIFVAPEGKGLRGDKTITHCSTNCSLIWKETFVSIRAACFRRDSAMVPCSRMDFLEITKMFFAVSLYTKRRISIFGFRNIRANRLHGWAC